MSLNHLLLGFAAESATGYDIKRSFEEGLRHMWNAELSQIYPALQRLEERGLLTSAKTPGERGFAKRAYKLSPEGRKELHRWLRSEPVLHDERHPFLIQLCLLSELDNYSETLKYFAALESILKARLQVMEQLREKWRRHDPAYPEVKSSKDFHLQMTLEFGLTNTQAALKCCQGCAARVKKRIASIKRSRGKNEKRAAA
jgi:DNA-binding PadR family transcriptional regulator